MARSLTLRNLYDKKFQFLSFDGPLAEVLGEPEKSGLWLIWGMEKNGKTWFALKLADILSQTEKVLYVSGEEGMGKAFKEACQRVRLDVGNRSLQFLEYTPLAELDEKLSKRKSARIVFIDNITVYQDELKNGGLRKLANKHESKLFIMLAHEERKEPYTSTAKLVKKLAKVIFYIKGLSCFVSGRCPGGSLIIDEDRATLYHGNINND